MCRFPLSKPITLCCAAIMSFALTLTGVSFHAFGEGLGHSCAPVQGGAIAQSASHRTSAALDEASQEEMSALFAQRAVAAQVAGPKYRVLGIEQETKGTYGFFEYEQSTYGNAARAMKAFKEAKYASWTSPGAPGDATCLDSLDKALRFIDECNAIRKKNGLKELKVTHYLMAVSELNLNWSAKKIGHSKQFDVGENLAWGYGSDAYDGNEHVITTKNPFEGWYEAEKELNLGVDLDGNGSVGNGMSSDGHYKNVVKGDYTTTGFAYSPNSSSYGDSFGQTFETKTTGTAYTVSQYRTHLANYRAYLQSIQSAYNAAAQELADAQAALTAAQTAYAAAPASEKAARQAAVDAAFELVESKRAALQAVLAGGLPGQAVTKEQAERYNKLPNIVAAKMTGFKSAVTYSHGDVEQNIKLAYGGKSLVRGKDFNVSYKNNSGVGTATLVVSGSKVSDTSTFKGSFSRTFKINPKGASIKKLTGAKGKLTVTWKTQRVETSGYQVRFSTKKNMKKAKVKKLAKNSYASLAVSGVKAKKYYVQIRTYKKAGKAKYYSSWSKKKSVKVK